jgi:ubiquinone/menaquinone biosynthesis C-methylase UbiE
MLMSDWDRKREIMRRYDETAHIYDMRYAEEQVSKIKAALKNIKTETLGAVLDVGCGTGILFDCVADNAEIVIGVDVSRRSLLEAKKRAEKYPSVHLVWADADCVPLRDKIFNYVFALTLVQNTPDPAATLNEIVRVGKKDATFIITGMKKAFTLEDFKALLQCSGLRISVLENGVLQCFVAVCRKA